MENKKSILIICLLLLILVSCSKLSPAGFWKNFSKDYVVKSNSDQGPYGGSREILWQSNNKNTFTSSPIINFATNNGWNLVDSAKIINSKLLDYNNQDYSLYIMNKDILSEYQIDSAKIYIFTTGWIAVEPGNARETDKNGFVILNHDGTELILFHRWGE